MEVGAPFEAYPTLTERSMVWSRLMVRGRLASGIVWKGLGVGAASEECASVESMMARGRGD
jgi:hypothetical protein